MSNEGKMGSSTRKKKEKKKDFQVCISVALVLFQRVICLTRGLQKPKLKVGKTKPKASNFTDTSFQSKCKLSSALTSAGSNGDFLWAQDVWTVLLFWPYACLVLALLHLGNL